MVLEPVFENWRFCSGRAEEFVRRPSSIKRRLLCTWKTAGRSSENARLVSQISKSNCRFAPLDEKSIPVLALNQPRQQPPRLQTPRPETPRVLYATHYLPPTTSSLSCLLYSIYLPQQRANRLYPGLPCLSRRVSCFNPFRFALTVSLLPPFLPADRPSNGSSRLVLSCPGNSLPSVWVHLGRLGACRPSSGSSIRFEICARKKRWDF
ncbi:hypothetical protein HDK77DRAFT_211018 [Phyllosticta capitalensis]|uniref:Uncharacterized protein n=1 Tax=Phyllosticta capitalensis TaxID=121624 RepID=A0ABR1Z3B9_9PEZI